MCQQAEATGGIHKLSEKNSRLLGKIPESLENIFHVKNHHWENVRCPGVSILCFRDFSHNEIIKVPETLFRACSKIVTIRLADNLLKVLPVSLVSGLALLEDLDVSSNRVEEIQAGTFWGLYSLKNLKLNENKLRIIPSGSNVSFSRFSFHFFFFFTEAFRDLAALEVLSLRRNRLEVISKGLFDPLKMVRFLDLSGNLVTKVSG